MVRTPKEELEALRRHATALLLAIEENSSFAVVKDKKTFPGKARGARYYKTIPDYAVPLCEQLSDCLSKINELAVRVPMGLQKPKTCPCAPAPES